MKLYFDIGASNTRIGISEDGSALGDTRILPTKENLDEHLAEFKKVTDELTQGEALEAACGGVAGPLNRKRSGIMMSYHEDWINRPLAAELENMLKCPVLLENDSALAGLGEARLGAGKGFGIVAYFSFSTGIGGARIVDGRIDRNAWGFEPRWQTASLDNGHPVFLDDLISGHAIGKRFMTKPEDMQDRRTWEEVEQLMAVCLLNGIGFWSPDIIVIGGGIGESHYVSVDSLRQRVFGSMDYQVDIPIAKASLGQLNGLHGAMAYQNDREKEFVQA